MIEASAGLYPGEKMKFRDTGHEICFGSIDVESYNEKDCRRVISQQTKMDIRQSQLLFWSESSLQCAQNSTHILKELLNPCCL